MMRPTALVAASLLLGCSQAWVPRDIDRDATLDALGAAGYQRLCGAFESYVQDEYASNYLVQAVCLAHGITTTEDAQTCADTAQSCTDNLPAPAQALLDEILNQASCEMLDIDPVGCSATVAQVSACLEAIDAAVKNIEFELTCAVAGQTIDPNWWRVQLPASCQSIRAICPAAP